MCLVTHLTVDTITHCQENCTFGYATYRAGCFEKRHKVKGKAPMPPHLHSSATMRGITPARILIRLHTYNNIAGPKTNECEGHKQEETSDVVVVAWIFVL